MLASNSAPRLWKPYFKSIEIDSYFYYPGITNMCFPALLFDFIPHLSISESDISVMSKYQSDNFMLSKPNPESLYIQFHEFRCFAQLQATHNGWSARYITKVRLNINIYSFAIM